MTVERAIEVLEDMTHKDTTIADYMEATGIAIDIMRRAPEPDDGWISVEERLPEPFVSVLVHMPGKRPGPTVHESYMSKERMWYSHLFERDFSGVTHWRPLPEPPKEGTDDDLP